MASPREYFDADFDQALRVQFKVPGHDDAVGAFLLDFASVTAFVACYVPGNKRTLQYFVELVSHLTPGKQITFDQRMQLPAARHFPGELKVENGTTIELQARFFGDPDWVGLKDFQGSKRVYIYSETQLSDAELLALKAEGRKCERDVHFRSRQHAEARSMNEKPLAFICHDSRDKEAVARRIALGLQKYLCPVWYDEFSLKVGDNLRDSIEHGLKVCKKCVLILSPSFVSNTGWTKREFDSIFTCEVFKRQRVLLPVWFDVTEQQVFDYSPSLLNVKGLNWNGLGEDEVIRQLGSAILAPSSD